MMERLTLKDDKTTIGGSILGLSSSWYNEASEPAQASTPVRTYDEQFTLRDGKGSPLTDTYHTIRLPSGSLVHGVTDSQGRTTRHETSGAQSIRIYLGHKQDA